MSFSAVLVLLRASIGSHRARLFAAIMAIAIAATVLLVSLVGQRVVREQAPRAAHSLLGDTELHIAAIDTVHPYLDEKLLAALQADPRVARLSTAVSVRAIDMPGTEQGDLDRDNFYSLGSGGMGGWITGRRDNFLAWDENGPRGKLVEGRWPEPGVTDPIEVIAPRVWGQKVGSWRRLESDTGIHRARVVGVIAADMSTVSTPQGVRLMSRQISRAAAYQLAGGPRVPSDARVTLHHAEDRSAFLADWQPRVAGLPGRIEFWSDDTIQQSSSR